MARPKGLRVRVFTNDTHSPRKPGKWGGFYFTARGADDAPTVRELTIVAYAGERGIKGGGDWTALPKEARCFHADEATAPSAALIRIDGDNWALVPISALQRGDGVKHRGWMAGGAFAHSNDSRFASIVGHNGAVAIHDRYEWADDGEGLR